MKKLILIFSVLLFQLNYSFANDKVIESLKEGGKFIFIRHALAPGNGDPENFELQNCYTQRNLNEIGIQQSKKIGLIFKKNEIKIDNIYSSEWCRCKDTAKYAFDDFETFDALNSFYDIRFAANEDKQIKDFYEFRKTKHSINNFFICFFPRGLRRFLNCQYSTVLDWNTFLCCIIYLSKTYQKN